MIIVDYLSDLQVEQQTNPTIETKSLYFYIATISFRFSRSCRSASDKAMLPESSIRLFKVAQEAFMKGNLNKAKSTLMEIEQKDCVVLFALGVVSNALGDKHATDKYYQMAIANGSVDALFNYALELIMRRK